MLATQVQTEPVHQSAYFPVSDQNNPIYYEILPNLSSLGSPAAEERDWMEVVLHTPVADPYSPLSEKSDPSDLHLSRMCSSLASYVRGWGHDSQTSPCYFTIRPATSRDVPPTILRSISLVVSAGPRDPRDREAPVFTGLKRRLMELGMSRMES